MVAEDNEQVKESEESEDIDEDCHHWTGCLRERGPGVTSIHSKYKVLLNPPKLPPDLSFYEHIRSVPTWSARSAPGIIGHHEITSHHRDHWQSRRTPKLRSGSG